MGVANDLLVPYAAAIIFELYKDVVSDNHFVKVVNYKDILNYHF